MQTKNTLAGLAPEGVFYCKVLFLFPEVFRQSKGLGELHHDERDEGQGEADQITVCRQGGQTKNAADRRKEHQTHQQDRYQGSQVQASVGEGTDLEQGVL